MNTDAAKRTALRKMKAVALTALLVAAVVFGLTYLGDDSGWVGFVRAGSEAAMVGGLADWFAVTALFRHPLGLPIPHTALIPTRKDQIGESLGDFVQENFLSREIVVARVREVRIVGRVGAWLAQPANASRVTDEVGIVLQAGLRDAGTAEVAGIAAKVGLGRLQQISYAPVAGRLLAALVADQRHRPLVDIVVTSTRRWLIGHRDVVIRSMHRVAPGGIPRFLKDPAVERVYEKACELAWEVERDRTHELRESVDALLGDYARRLQRETAATELFDSLVHEALGHPATERAVQDLIGRALAVLADLAQEPDGPVRTALLERLVGLGERLRDDAAFAERVEGLLERLVGHVVTTYGDEISRLISDTVARWDASETTERIELQVGRDLQFIRINGTVVGSLAGLAIHAVTVLA